MNAEIPEFLRQWELVAEGTIALLRALPQDQYDFRPDPMGRSMGELAWPLAEVDGYVSIGIEKRVFHGSNRPPHIERPRTVAALAPAFRIVHDEARRRLERLQRADLDQQLQYADGTTWTIRDLLRQKLLQHAVHHRGQLALQLRLAGGMPPPLYGGTREQTHPGQLARTT